MGFMFAMTTLLFSALLTFESVPAMSYVAIVAVILFVVGFATGPGSIPWFFVTELFAQSGRPTATSIAVTVNWSANFLVGLGFAPLNTLLGPYVFVIFMVIQLFFILYVYFVVPETKNRTTGRSLLDLENRELVSETNPAYHHVHCYTLEIF